MKEKSHQRRLFLLDDSWDVVRLVIVNFKIFRRFDLVSLIDYARNIFIRILSAMFFSFQVRLVNVFSFLYECLNKSSLLSLVFMLRVFTHRVLIVGIFPMVFISGIIATRVFIAKLFML